MHLTISDLQSQILRGPALVIGPGATTSLGREEALWHSLEKAFPFESENIQARSFLEYSDILIASGITTEAAVRNHVQTFLKETLSQNPNLDSVIGANWTAIVGLCFDNNALEALKRFVYRTPTKWSVSSVVTSDDNLPQVTIPYFQLLGDISDKREPYRLAVSRSQYLKRVRSWSQILAQLPDVFKSDPLLFLGTESIPERVCDFMNEMLRIGPKAPRKLIFLENDPTYSNSVFRNLVSDFCEIQIVAGTLRELSNCLSQQSISISKLPLFSRSAGQPFDLNVVTTIEDQVAYIPKRDEMEVNEYQRNQHLDAPFRPTHLNWNPYYLNMQFRRSICDDIKGAICHAFAGENNLHGSKIIRIYGEAGIGKTVALRTVAFEMAQEGYLCFWVKKAYGELSGGWFGTVVDRIAKALRTRDYKIAFFVDDPGGNRIRVSELLAVLTEGKLNWALVVCTRRSDALLAGSLSAIDVEPDSVQIEIPENFANDESDKLPEYLLSLGLAHDLDSATKMVMVPGLKHSRDILCSLWYMLPQTQGAIAESLIAEYHSLGQVESSITALATSASSTKAVARVAYELVTTASGFENTPLPVEVLVSALNISYSEWADSCNEGKPLWGLLYDEEYKSAETYAYRTRNYIVTQVLLRLLNNGTSGHTGEFRCLKLLVGACKSSAAPYRVFLKDILVDRRKQIEARSTLEQAMELYDLAEWAYPKPYPLIEHHKCLAKNRLRGNHAETYEVLNKLIRQSYDRSILDQDSPANLNTSAAATLNRMVKQGEVDPRIGAERAFEHVSNAPRDDQYSMHAHHVHADMLVNLADSLREGDDMGLPRFDGHLGVRVRMGVLV